MQLQHYSRGDADVFRTALLVPLHIHVVHAALDAMFCFFIPQLPEARAVIIA